MCVGLFPIVTLLAILRQAQGAIAAGTDVPAHFCDE